MLLWKQSYLAHHSKINLNPRLFGLHLYRSHTSTVVSKSGDHVTKERVFPYPDPYKIKGDPAFSVRIAELTRLECDTIKYEDWKKRTSASKGSTVHLPSNSGNLHLSRSMSARSFRPATSKGVSESVLKPSTSVAGKRQFGTAPLLSRKSSLPATLNSAGIDSMYSSGGHHSRSLSVESCSNRCSNSSPPSPTPTSSRLSLSSGLQWPRREARCQTKSSTMSASLEEDLHCSAAQSKAASMPLSSSVQASSQCPITSKDMNKCVTPVEENSMIEGEHPSESTLQMKGSTQNKDQQRKTSHRSHAKDTDSSLHNPGLSSQVSTACSIAESEAHSEGDGVLSSCEIGSYEDKDDLQVTSILELSVDSLHLSQEEGVMSSIPEHLDNYSSDNENHKINKANSPETARNDTSANSPETATKDTSCRKKSKRKGGKKRSSKMRSHSTPRLEYTASVYSSHSTCSLKSTKCTKTRVHRKVKNWS